MKNLTLICSPKYEFELNEHPQAREKLFGNCEILKNNQDIVLYGLSSFKKFEIQDCKNIEAILAKKVDFLSNTYLELENFEASYMLKEIEILQPIFEDMGAVEVSYSQSLRELINKNDEIFGEFSAKRTVQDIEMNANIDANYKIEACKETKIQSEKKASWSGRKKPKREIEEYINQNSINLEGFGIDAKKAIEDYLKNEEVNTEEIVIKHTSSEICNGYQDIVAGIGLNLDMYSQLSIAAAIKTNIKKQKKMEKEVVYSWRVVFKRK